MRTISRHLAGLLSALVLSGCATVQRTAGVGEVDRHLSARTGEQVSWQQTAEERHAAETKVSELLATELTVEKAVRIALLAVARREDAIGLGRPLRQVGAERNNAPIQNALGAYASAFPQVRPTNDPARFHLASGTN